MGLLRRPSTLIPLLGLVILGAWAVASMWWPFCYDQAVFGWVGDVMVHGGMPYRDAWDLKGPAAYLQYAGIEAVLGKAMWAVRLVDVLSLVAGLWGVRTLASRLAGREAGLWAMAFAGLWYATHDYGNVSQPDGWAAMLTTVALGLVVSPRPSAWLRAFVAGLLMGWVALYKPILVVLAPLPLLALDLGGAERPIRTWLKATGVYCAAYGILVALVLVWVSLRGAMAQMEEILLVFNKTVYWTGQRPDLVTVLVAKRMLLLLLAPLVFLGTYGLVLISPPPDSRRIRAAVIVWGLLGLALVLAQGKYFAYHWQHFGFAVATAAGVGVGLLRDRCSGGASQPTSDAPRTRPAMAYLVGSAVLLMLLCRVLPPVGLWARSALGLAPWRSYYAAFRPATQPGLTYLSQVGVAAYLREHTPPGDSDFVWGFGPLIFYLSGVPCASRFSFPQALITTRYTSAHFWREYSGELMQSLTNRPPAFIVVGDLDATQATPYDSMAFLPMFPALRDLISRGYALDTSIGSFEIYRRRGPPS